MPSRGRAVVYARFSSDLQRDRSIEDQLALCEAYCAKEGLAIVHRYSDRARSGASIFGRDGLLALMEASAAGSFDCVVVEALDRLSRDQEDLAGIFKRLSFRGIAIRAVHDGEADEIQVGIRGLVGALYLKDLANKVRRGQAGVIRDGRHAGGRAYGYRPVPGKPGELAIVDGEADVVRRIFQSYVEGLPPRRIASQLNAERVPAPRGKSWAASAINGSRKRKSGILQNALYDGRIAWNRVRMVKDPESGRRLSRTNPESEWTYVEAPHLRIVSEELFAAAASRRQLKGGERPQDRRRPRHLLSGLLRCKCCGGGMSVKDRSAGRLRVQCTQQKEGGSCGNRTAYYLDRIEKAVLEGLRERLANREAIAAYVREYNATRQAEAADTVARHRKLSARVEAARQELDRTIDYAVKGVISETAARDRIPPLEAGLAQLEAELAEADEPPKIITLLPAAVDRYLAEVDMLDQALREHGEAGETGPYATLRSLIDRITIDAPQAETGRYPIEISGKLARLIGGEPFPQCSMLGGLVVAEARLTQSPHFAITIFC